MVKVHKKDTEDITVTIRKFFKKVGESEILKDLKSRESYKKPSEEKREKHRQALIRESKEKRKRERKIEREEFNKESYRGKEKMEDIKSNRTVFIGGLPYTTTEQEVLDLFKEVCQVRNVKIIVHPETKQSKGFGFVELFEASDIPQVIDAFDQQEFQGRKLTIKLAHKQEKKK